MSKIRLKVKTPVRKKKGKELSDNDKRYNKKLNRERVVVEHSIRRIKTFNIMGQEFRNGLRSYDDVMSITSGLVNFGLMRQDGFDLTEFVG